MNFFFKIIPVIFILGLGIKVQGQETTMQVVTKKISRTVNYQPGYELSIDGEKANVLISTWDQQKIKIEIELIAKHQDLEIAKRDLKAMGYNIEEVGKKVIVRNYLINKKGKAKPESIFKAAYVITIPEECPVDLRNHFGKVDVKNLKQALDVRSEFCEILLDNIKGKIGLETRFGDVDGKKISGFMKIQSMRSNITLTEIKGSVDITAKFGKIEIDANRSLIDLNIMAEKTDIVFLNPAKESYSFDLTTYHGDISVPDFMDFNFKEKNESLNKAELNLPDQEGKVSIQTTFGNIVILRVDQK